MVPSEYNLTAISLIHNALGHTNSSTCNITLFVIVNYYIINIFVYTNLNLKFTHFIFCISIIIMYFSEYI